MTAININTCMLRLSEFRRLLVSHAATHHWPATCPWSHLLRSTVKAHGDTKRSAPSNPIYIYIYIYVCNYMYLYLSIYLSISLSLSIYIYIS